MSSANTCYGFWSAYPLDEYLPFVNHTVGMGGAALGMLCVLNAGCTLYWIESQKRKAKHGDEDAVRYVIFPAYIPLVWLSIFTDLLFGASVLLLDLTVTGENPWSWAIIRGFTFGMQHLTAEGIAFALLQPGCGSESVHRSMKQAAAWSCLTWLIYTLYFHCMENTFSQIIVLLWYLGLQIFYGVNHFASQKYFSRRASMVFYSGVWFYIKVLYITAFIWTLFGDKEVGGCIYMGSTFIYFGILKNLTIYRTLLMDSLHWQAQALAILPTAELAGKDGKKRSYGGGRESRDSDYTTVFPNRGLDVTFENAQSLAETVDDIYIGGSVRLLNFSYIALSKKELLGAGSFSRVYKGMYKGTTVAVKLLQTMDLNRSVIRRAATEAKILSEISHPNVVQIYGFAVNPPSVCIVLEMCSFGSLADFIHKSDGVGGGGNERCMHLSDADRYYLAMGCCLGLTVLHDFRPDLVHRDVKSFNFLVDKNLTVKIADLELGGDDDEGENKVDVVKDGRLARWLAPEMLRGEAATQASDCYSLALVLWEILVRRYPFYYAKDEDVPTLVLKENTKPVVPACCPKLYKDAMEKGWATDPKQRLTAREMLARMRECWHDEVYSRVFRQTPNVVDMDRFREHAISIDASKRRSSMKLSLPGWGNRGGTLWASGGQMMVSNEADGKDDGEAEFMGPFEADQESWDKLSCVGACLVLSPPTECRMTDAPKNSKDHRTRKVKKTTSGSRLRFLGGGGDTVNTKAKTYMCPLSDMDLVLEEASKPLLGGEESCRDCDGNVVGQSYRRTEVDSDDETECAAHSTPVDVARKDAKGTIYVPPNLHLLQQKAAVEEQAAATAYRGRGATLSSVRSAEGRDNSTVTSGDTFAADTTDQCAALFRPDDGIARTCTEETRVMWLNPAFRKLTGYNLADYFGRSVDSCVSGPQTDAAQLRDAFIHATVTGVPAHGVTMFYRRDPQMEPLLCSFHVFPILDNRPKIVSPTPQKNGFLGKFFGTSFSSQPATPMSRSSAQSATPRAKPASTPVPSNLSTVRPAFDSGAGGALNDSAINTSTTADENSPMVRTNMNGTFDNGAAPTDNVRPDADADVSVMTGPWDETESLLNVSVTPGANAVKNACVSGSSLLGSLLNMSAANDEKPESASVAYLVLHVSPLFGPSGDGESMRNGGVSTETTDHLRYSFV